MNDDPFGSVKITGGLLPSDLLGRILAGDPEVPALGPESYGLQRGESVRRQASRSWDYLIGVWQEFKERREATPESQWTQLTRERWLHILLRELGFQDLRANPAVEIEGRSFPVSHLDGDVPVHLLAWQTDLDHRTPGRVARAPESMLQELLNRSGSYLWAVLSNGSSLRLLRDSRKLAGNAYVEFDLEALFDGELFADFVLLYRICHRSRFAGDPPPLEQWLECAADIGTRALQDLRKGVEEAIGHLGTGFLSHPSNPHLRHQMNGSRELRIDDFNRALLRIVYRLLFWFVAEDRRVLLPPGNPLSAQDRYAQFFSSARLRRLARQRLGSGAHGDLWDAVELVFSGLGSEGGLPQLGLPGLGGVYEGSVLDEPLAGARLSNQALLAAVRAICVVAGRDGGGRRPVDFGNLGAEELGSVYESLLERVPRYDPEERTYSLVAYVGNERKESGSYYTPSSLVECLLDSALDPLLDECCSRPGTESRVAALLDLTVCDPACGSGHFLVAAARRIALRVAAEETGEPSPSGGAVRSALRRVVGRCIYGVDINPMAAELARVSLWMEAIEPGRPLSFLDANIRVGNALLGVTPALLRKGIPDAAFKPLEGDDRAVVTSLRRQNAAERAGQGDLFSVSEIEVRNAAVAKEMAAIVSVVPISLEDVHVQALRARALLESPQRERDKLVADAWCAAFVQEKTQDNRQFAVTDAILHMLSGDAAEVAPEALDQVRRLARDYRFFHWHVEFPHIFRTGNGVADAAVGWYGGFSCVIGNPPWEKIEVKEQEFFAQRKSAIANASNAAKRKRMIARLASSDDPDDRELYAEFDKELRKSAGWTHLLKESDRYPLTGRGRLNTYAAFAETGSTVVAPAGRFGFVLPTGIGTDATTAPFFRDLVQRSALVAFLDFENEAFLLSHAVHHSVRFCLLTACGSNAQVQRASFAFGTRYIEQLGSRRFTMPPEEILFVNPNTGTCPVFRSRRDAEITIGIYRRVPVLWREIPEENPWELTFMQGLFNMASDAGLFRTREQLTDDGWTPDGNMFVRDFERMLPLYEAKMIHLFDHRLGTYEGQTEAQANVGTLPRLGLEQKTDPECVVQPRYWVLEFSIRNEEKSTEDEDVYDAGVSARLEAKGWNHDWLLGWRDICRSTDERTMICSLLPRVGTGDTVLLALADFGSAVLDANLSAFVAD